MKFDSEWNEISFLIIHLYYSNGEENTILFYSTINYFVLSLKTSTQSNNILTWKEKSVHKHVLFLSFQFVFPISQHATISIRPSKIPSPLPPPL